MKNTIKKSLAVILSLVLSVSLFAFAGSAASDYLTFTVDTDGYAVLTKCSTKANGDIVVPSIAEIDGKAYEVKGIDDNAFADCENVTSISIAEGITSIGAKAFLNCTALTDVYIPQSLSVCQYNAFSGCVNVTVHCYSSNYQFFTVYGINQNININVLDSEQDGGFGGGSSSSMTTMIINIIKRVILAILSIFTGSST